MLLCEQFQHLGQIPAYEWDVLGPEPRPRLAVWRVTQDASAAAGRPRFWSAASTSSINFSVVGQQVDRAGNNVFEGGFLGLDNITVIDRSEPLPAGAVLEQSDATGWMGMFCLNLMRMALELAKENRVYESLATKFFEHYIYVGAAMKRMGGRKYQLWDEEDGFFYDVLRFPDGTFEKFRVRSLVGLVPLYAVERWKSTGRASRSSGQPDWSSGTMPTSCVTVPLRPPPDHASYGARRREGRCRLLPGPDPTEFLPLGCAAFQAPPGAPVPLRKPT